MLDSGTHIQIHIVCIIYRYHHHPPPYHLKCKTYSTTLIKINIAHVDQSYLSLGQQCHYMYHSTSIVSYQYLCMYCLLVKGNKLGHCNGRIEPHDICTESRKNCEKSHLLGSLKYVPVVGISRVQESGFFALGKTQIYYLSSAYPMHDNGIFRNLSDCNLSFIWPYQLPLQASIILVLSKANMHTLFTNTMERTLL